MDLLRPSDKQHDSTGNRQHGALVMESAQLDTKHLVISVTCVPLISVVSKYIEFW